MKKNNNIVSKDITIFSALKLMDEIKRKLLYIVEENNKFLGVLSLGDIQRAIINKTPLDKPIHSILRKIITTASTSQSFDDIKSVMLANRTESMPVIDEKGYLVRIVEWDEITTEVVSETKEEIALPVVIMAGGKGSRLKPLTNVFPKPMIPIGDKTIAEDIMDSFIEYGCTKFWFSVNYMADRIQYYFDKYSKGNYDISYFQEGIPLGTAGSLRLLKGKINQTFFVTNCDIIIEQDYAEILNYHRDNKNEMTVAAALKSFKIPYGTIETRENGLLDSMQEKPEFHMHINTGFYILEPHLIDEIPENTSYNMTSLIEKLQSESRRVGVFPVLENSWKDIGDWREYLQLIGK